MNTGRKYSLCDVHANIMYKPWYNPRLYPTLTRSWPYSYCLPTSWLHTTIYVSVPGLVYELHQLIEMYTYFFWLNDLYIYLLPAGGPPHFTLIGICNSITGTHWFKHWSASCRTICKNMQGKCRLSSLTLNFLYLFLIKSVRYMVLIITEYRNKIRLSQWSEWVLNTLF